MDADVVGAGPQIHFDGVVGTAGEAVLEGAIVFDVAKPDDGGVVVGVIALVAVDRRVPLKGDVGGDGDEFEVEMEIFGVATLADAETVACKTGRASLSAVGTADIVVAAATAFVRLVAPST